MSYEIIILFHVRLFQATGIAVLVWHVDLGKAGKLTLLW